jgi:hypothetical protein
VRRNFVSSSSTVHCYKQTSVGLKHELRQLRHVRSHTINDFRVVDGKEFVRVDHHEKQARVGL